MFPLPSLYVGSNEAASPRERDVAAQGEAYPRYDEPEPFDAVAARKRPQ